MVLPGYSFCRWTGAKEFLLPYKELWQVEINEGVVFLIECPGEWRKMSPHGKLGCALCAYDLRCKLITNSSQIRTTIVMPCNTIVVRLLRELSFTILWSCWKDADKASSLVGPGRNRTGERSHKRSTIPTWYSCGDYTVVVGHRVCVKRWCCDIMAVSMHEQAYTCFTFCVSRSRYDWCT